MPFHSADFGDVSNAPDTVRKPRKLDDEMQGRSNLLTDRPVGEVKAGHEDHVLDTSKAVTRRVGVDGRHRSLVTRVHGVEHVERFLATDLADDDPVRTHAQCVAEEISLGYLAAAVYVGRPRLQTHDVRLLHLDLDRVLNRDDALCFRDVGRERVEERGLAGTGTAGDEDVQFDLHAGLQELHHVFGDRAGVDQVVHLQLVGAEFSDGDRRAFGCDGRNHDVDTRAVRKTGVHHRRRLIDPPSDRRDDALNDALNVLIVTEADVAEVENTFSFEVDLVRSIDHDL